MPGYHQNTFTLITERVAPVTDEPIRPMTSKQIKKAHRAANKAPKISRAEQRKIELAEQERIRKELEKDRQANRARAARDKKKAKEDKEKDERRKKGQPLVDVRPSQDTIARFVRGNGWGNKRDDAGNEVSKMAPLMEEESETADNNETEAEKRKPEGPPAPEYEAALPADADQGNDDENAAVPLDANQKDDKEKGEAVITDPELEARVPSKIEHSLEVQASNTSEAESQNDLGPAELDEDHEQLLEDLRVPSVNAKAPAQSKQRSSEYHSPRDHPSQVDLALAPPKSSLSSSSQERGQQQQHVVQEPAGSKLPVALPVVLPAAFVASQAFSDGGLDDDLMQKLEAAEQQDDKRGNLRHEPEKQPHGLSFRMAPSRASADSQPLGALLKTQRTDYGDLEDDIFAGLGTQAVGLWEQEDEDSLLAEQHLPSLQQPEQATLPRLDTVPEENIGEDDDTLEALETIFERYSSPEPAPKPSSKKDSKTHTSDRPPKHSQQPLSATTTPKEISSFTEDDLDDEMLEQLDIELQLEGTLTAIPASTMKPHPPNVKLQPPAALRQSSPREVDGADRLMPPPPIPQPPPISTQAVLSNFDDYFPSPSQQERELDDDCGEFLRSQPTPCPPPKRPRPQQQRLSKPSSMEPPKSQKRFFSNSGSNELLSLAIHRSKRDAAMEDLHRREQQRLEAGRVQAKQAAHQGRQFLAQRQQNALRSLDNQTGRLPRPAGKPPAWVTNENIEPPPKRQKMTRTKSQVRPPAFKQPNTTRPTASPKPPVFKPSVKPAPQAAGKENGPQDLAPMASQSSDYGGDWIDEMAMDMVSAGRGCLSATQMAVDQGNGRWIR